MFKTHLCKELPCSSLMILRGKMLRSSCMTTPSLGPSTMPAPERWKRCVTSCFFSKVFCRNFFMSPHNSLISCRENHTNLSTFKLFHFCLYRGIAGHPSLLQCRGTLLDIEEFLRFYLLLKWVLFFLHQIIYIVIYPSTKKTRHSESAF